MNYLILDPGLRNPAIALFANNVLVYAGRVKIPAAVHKLEMGLRMREVGRLVLEQVKHRLWPIDFLVTEWPRTYRRMKGDPADLFPLAGVGMYVAGRLDVDLQTPTAPEWIGNLAKNEKGDPLDSPRGKLVWSKLLDVERDVVVLSHDALDAVGIGLWKLGRLGTLSSFAVANGFK